MVNVLEFAVGKTFSHYFDSIIIILFAKVWAKNLLNINIRRSVPSLILGHFDIRTTERYLHVSKNNLVNIISPLDDLWRKGKIDW